MDKALALTLMLIFFGAYFMPFVARRLMLPSSVAEFFFGMVIGIFFFDTVNGFASIQFLSALGFLLLMYIAGLELDFDMINALNRRELFAYGGYAFLLIGGSVGATFLFRLPLFFALVITTTAIGLLFSVMKDLDIVKTKLGQTMLLLGAIGEVITLVGLTLVSLVARAGTSRETAVSLLGIAAFIGVVFFFLKLLRFFLWWNPDKTPIFMAVGNSSETGVRANLLNMFIFVALAVYAGVEAILGAFLGGVVFARLFADREEMLERLSSFGYGFLIPVFFIEVGSRFRFSDFAVPEVLKGALMVSFLVLLVRAVAVLPLLMTDLPRKQLVYIPLSQSFPLTLFVAAAAMGDSTGLISRNQTSIIILTAVITSIFYPWFMKLVYRVIPVYK